MKFLILLIALTLSGCFTSTSKYIGFNKDALVDALGVPERTVKIDDSTEAWEYGDPGTTYRFEDGIVVDEKKRSSWSVSIGKKHDDD